MNTELINIIKQEDRSVVSARELFASMEMDLKNFSKWRKVNIEENDFFEENVDYLINVLTTETPKQAILVGRPTKDYLVTIDMAKHLCMMSRCKKGREVREYFIRCEKELGEKTFVAVMDSYMIQDPVLRAKRWIEECEEKLTLENKNKEQQLIIEEAQPKLEAHKQFIESDTGIDFELVAKNLGLGRNRLLEILRNRNILQTQRYKNYKGNMCSGEKHNVPYQRFINSGYFEIKFYTYIGKNVAKVLVTPKGQEWIRKGLVKEEILQIA